MLATFVIGLREGLEGALIIGIIAAFLRNNGKSLVPMWIGVGLAMALAMLVGAALDLVEQALPQAAQEGMETVIGGIALVFVTGMIVWMNKHARSMKRELEAQAAEALTQTGAFALAAMAFLAVLREGFETSVFLLASFSAAQSTSLAAVGAVLGLLLALVIGWGIYAGGVRINLGNFFRVTGAFLILVAAGLVMAACRTAHEAGWLNAGQQLVINLSWLITPGTIQSALITGMLGVYPDPRLIEVLGWLAYLLPVALYIYWPRSRCPSPRNTVRLQCAAAGILLISAAGLAILYPVPQLRLPAQADVVTMDGDAPRIIGTAQWVDGSIRLSLRETAKDAPSTLTLDQLVALSGGRIPVGLNAALHPGPFTATWTRHQSIHLRTAHAVLLDAGGSTTTILTLSGSGLSPPRIIALAQDKAMYSGQWRLSDAYVSQVQNALNAVSLARMERQFWAVYLPVGLVVIAALFFIFALRRISRSRNEQMSMTRLANPLMAGLCLATALTGLALSSRAQAQTAPVTHDVAQVHIALTADKGGSCVMDHSSAKAGPITFTVQNKAAPGLTELELLSEGRIIGEQENLAPGLPATALTLTLDGGSYQLYCPGANPEMQTFTVIGRAAAQQGGNTADLLAAGAKGYAGYVNGVADAMLTAVGILEADIDAGNLAKARAEYPLARPFYERIESDVNGFILPGFKATDNAGNLDYLVDMRASNLDPQVGWHGFHAIERDLFQTGQITDHTKALAAELQTNVALLAKLVRTISFAPEDLANGAASLLEEVQTTKITGEEEAFSHIDLVDFVGDVEGAQQAFAFLEPGMQTIDPALTERVKAQFAKVIAMLDTYRDRSIPGGYALYTAQVKASDAAKLSKAIQALQEPLSKIAEKVATAGTATSAN
ncbi:iron uptake system protein EfeO [Acidisoma silvae]|uniref:FTR1 family protein n=1 Tax=Acidisoma silvae TaxID=2802396 RepID=A0A963YS75_9PROT|nr:iron uptake system protein EfeO [Acidisoma silvae]MCB8876052.1 FTR1 family protein [Acidisoma silvae]